MSKKLHLRIEMATVNISMSYLVIAAMTKKGSHTVSVMHVAMSLFLEFLYLFFLKGIVWVFYSLKKFTVSLSHTE